MERKITRHQLGKDALYKTWHASKDHIFIYFYSDGGSIVSTEKVFPIKKGTLVFIAADTYHYTMPEEPALYDRSKLIISKPELDKVLDMLYDNSLIKSFRNKAIVYSEINEKHQPEIDRLFDETLLLQTDSEQQLLWFSCCFKLLLFLNKYSTKSSPSAVGIIAKAIDYINNNISSDIDIDAICRFVNMSKYHFCRQFKKSTGMTVMQYVLKTRVTLAKNELEKSALSISEISEKYGFSSVSYFCRTFRQQENCTPLQYRKNTN